MRAKQGDKRRHRRSALNGPDQTKYLLRLYVSGATPRSSRAIVNLKALCKKHLPEGYILQVIDIYQQPELAKTEQIVAAPTLIKHLPLPLRRFIGDMSKTERILLGLDLVAAAKASNDDDESEPSIPHTPRF